MGTIRKQSIISSLLTFAGFFVGAVNTYLFAHKDFFRPEEYGLTQTFVALNLIFFSFASFGTTSIMSRFFPYYNDGLKKEKNDLLSLAVIISLIGFIIMTAGAFFFESTVIRKFSGKSPLLVKYYYWVLVFSFFYIFYVLFETHSSINKRTILPNFLRETGFRILVAVLIMFFILNWISFDSFIKLYSFIYLPLAAILFFHLYKLKSIFFTSKISDVTKGKAKEMLGFISYVYIGNIIFYVAQNIDSITISSQKGLEYTGVFIFSSYIANIITVPQRSVVSIATPFLSQAWKDENYAEIQRIYSRSSVNLLIVSLFIFFNIWINIDDTYSLLNLGSTFESGKYVILMLGIKCIIDLGTGVNSQMLYTSPSWRFEFISGVVLLFLTVPLNYFMVKSYGINGAALATLISVTVYNAVRLVFIYRKYNMQPFSLKTLYAVAVAILAFTITYLLFYKLHGLAGIIIKSTFFSVIFIIAAVKLNLSPDISAVKDALKKRLTGLTEKKQAD
jgi:O-antigen/teichoic acid export membrane protein